MTKSNIILIIFVCKFILIVSKYSEVGNGGKKCKKARKIYPSIIYVA